MSKLLPNPLPTPQKLLFKTHESLIIKKGKTRLHFSLFILSEVLKLFQYISAIVYTGGSIKYYNSIQILAAISKYSRIDVILISQDQVLSLHIIIIIVILTNLLSKVSLAYLFYSKRNSVKILFVELGKLSNWLINTFVLVPMTFYVSNTCSVLLGRETGKNESIDLIKGVDAYMLTILALLLLIVYVLRFFDVVLGNIPSYSNDSVSRAHSIPNVQELLTLVLIGICRFVFDHEYFLNAFIVLASVNLYSFLYYIPYYSLFINKLLVQVWSCVLFSCVLLLISQKYNNMLIAELNFIVLSLALVPITNEVVKKRLELIKTSALKDPYTSELYLRNQILYEKTSANIETEIFEHFKTASKVFFNFKIQYVWESVMIKKYLKNKNLSLMKLVKVNAVKYFKKAAQGSVIKINLYEYKYNIEIDFLVYTIFKRLNKKIFKVSEDLRLVKYFNYFKTIKRFDERVLFEILNLIQNLTGSANIESIERKIRTIGKLVNDYKEAAKKVSVKFGVDKKFIKLYASFLIDVLNSNEGQTLLSFHGLRYNFDHSLIHESSNFDESDPLLVISGWCQNLGTIVYANSSIFSLLKINLESKLIGTSFTSLIPEPFDAIHEKVLFRYLFFRNSCELSRNHLFLIDERRFCIEVTMHFRLVFYRGYPYFVAGFKPYHKVETNMILCLLDGRIVSFSDKVQDFFPSLHANIFESLKEIESLIRSSEYNQVFEYEHEDKSYMMKKTLLSIDGHELLIIYFMDNLEEQQTFYSLNSKKQKKVHITETAAENSRNFKVSIKHELKKDSRRPASSQARPDKVHKSINRTLKIMNIIIRVLIFFEVLLILTNLIIILNVIKSISVNSIIFDIGLMRYLSCSILSNTYSLELLEQNYSLAFNESFYKLTLKNNSMLLQYLIDSYREITLPFLNEKKNYFSDTYVTMYKSYNESFEPYQGILINAMENVALYSSTLSNSSKLSYKSLLNERMFILRNIPYLYINTLNDTVMNVMNDLITSLDKIFLYLSYVELLCLLPPALMILLCSVTLILIERSNKEFWSIIFENSSKSIIRTKGKLVNRLYFFHEQEYAIEDEGKKFSKSIYKMITVKPCLKIAGFALIALSFYLSITYGPQQILLTMMKERMIHTNFGGMRRMLTPLTLFWERNALLHVTGQFKYEDLVKTYDVPSSYQELNFRAEQMRLVQDGLMKNLRGIMSEEYGFGEYMKLMYGDACSIIDTVANCSGTIAVSGLDAALNFYVTELKSQTSFYEDVGFRPGMFVAIEKYSKVIEKSFVFGLFVYANYTDVVVEELKGDMSLTTYGFMVLFILYYVVFLHRMTREISLNLECKETILQVFNDEEMNRKPGVDVKELQAKGLSKRGLSMDFDRVSNSQLTLNC